MMANYLLPCTCGRKTPVSTRHAGQTIRCQCGAELEVPTLRGLEGLERAEQSARSTPRAWGQRQQVVFALLVGAVVSFALAAFMAVRMPAKLELQVVEINAHTPILDVYRVYDDFPRGIDIDPPSLMPAEREQMKLRELLLWGVRIALSVGGACTLAAIVAMLSGRSQKR